MRLPKGDTAEWLYYFKKGFALYPGVRRPVSAPMLADHYERRRQGRSRLRAAIDGLIGAAFLAWLPWRVRQVGRKFGKDAQWRRQTLAICRARFADPNDVALFRISEAKQFDTYIRRFEDAALNKRINPLGWSRNCVLVDKRAFYHRLAAAGIPHPKVLAVVADGRCEQFDLPTDGPLIAKPSHGEGGRGVTAVPPELAEMTDRSAFATALVGLTGTARPVWLVQERIANHAALADYACDALVTARMTTIRNEEGRPELVNAVLRTPSGPGPIIDNMKAGGFIIPLDLAAGRAGTACKGYGGADYLVHPVTNAQFDALVLPDWSAAVELVRTAHRDVFYDYALIGWDVAFTPAGPMIVEGNAKPGVLMPQRSGRAGLAQGRYGELLAFNLAKAERACARRVKSGSGRNHDAPPPALVP